jgi:hypothetical protein
MLKNKDRIYTMGGEVWTGKSWMSLPVEKAYYKLTNFARRHSQGYVRAFSISCTERFIFDIISYIPTTEVFMAITAKIEGSKLIVTADLETQTPNASRKTLVVASTHGNKQTDVMINGKPVIIGLNSFIKW